MAPTGVAGPTSDLVRGFGAQPVLAQVEVVLRFAPVASRSSCAEPGSIKTRTGPPTAGRK
jgi:hypothetical protein